MNIHIIWAEEQANLAQLTSEALVEGE